MKTPAATAKRNQRTLAGRSNVRAARGGANPSWSRVKTYRPLARAGVILLRIGRERSRFAAETAGGPNRNDKVEAYGDDRFRQGTLDPDCKPRVP